MRLDYRKRKANLAERKLRVSKRERAIAQASLTPALGSSQECAWPTLERKLEEERRRLSEQH